MSFYNHFKGFLCQFLAFALLFPSHGHTASYQSVQTLIDIQNQLYAHPDRVLEESQYQIYLDGYSKDLLWTAFENSEDKQIAEPFFRSITSKYATESDGPFENLRLRMTQLKYFYIQSLFFFRVFKHGHSRIADKVWKNTLTSLQETDFFRIGPELKDSWSETVALTFLMAQKNSGVESREDIVEVMKFITSQPEFQTHSWDRNFTDATLIPSTDAAKFASKNKAAGGFLSLPLSLGAPMILATTLWTLTQEYELNEIYLGNLPIGMAVCGAVVAGVCAGVAIATAKTAGKLLNKMKKDEFKRDSSYAFEKIGTSCRKYLVGKKP